MASTTLPAADVARLADRLAQEVGQRRYELWFEQSAKLDLDDQASTLRVAVPSRFFADRIGRTFGDSLRRLAAEELGDGAEFSVSIDPSRFELPADTPSPASPHAAAEAAARTREPARAGSTDPRPRSAPRFRHRLASFVTGPSNQLAFAAAHRLAEDDDAADPVFIHGGCGLGKTHLLQGACARMLERNPGSRVWYTTGEQFTNQYIQAVRTNAIDAFRKRVRRMDLLAVDDVHFIANKDKTQQEFLHCFDAIDLAGARLMLASDCHPKQIAKFSEALISRCVRGLVVEVRQPDAQTRRALVQVLADRRGLVLREEALDTLAARCTGSVREIEGLLTKLHALASLTRNPNTARAGNEAPATPHPIGHALLDQLFAAADFHGQTGPVRFETILKTVCDRLDVPPGKVTGSSRHKHVVLARSLVIHLTRGLRDMSYPEIAHAFGKKTHSTIITADKRIEKMLRENERVLLPGAGGQDTTLRALLDELRAALARA